MLKKDIDYKKGLVLAALFVLIRLVFASQQMMFIMPSSAPLDDDLYFKWAQSIASGNWLGEYDYMTLSKYPFFAVYLAALHILHIPYLMGNAVLWIIGGVLSVMCLAPILKKNWHKIIFFASFIFNPCTFTEHTLRVYRDGIFPLLCTMFFIGMTGWALRLKKHIKYNIGYLILSGISLGLAYITREDGYWLLPFAIAASVICAVYIIIDKQIDKKALRLISMTIPGIITVLAVITICSINYIYYDVFTLTDFNSGAFARCYGAMTTLHHENWRPLVTVPKDVRERMYEECPSFAPFEEYLEEDGIVNAGYCSPRTGDYQAGSFYWAIRKAAQYIGIYETPHTAENFWNELADEVESLRASDENSLPPRASLTPPIRTEYVVPVIEEAFYNMYHIAMWSVINPEEDNVSDNYTGEVQEWEEFLHQKSNYAAIENTDSPYYTPFQLFNFKIMDGIIWIYRLLTIPMLIYGLYALIKSFINFKKQNFEKQIMSFVLLGFIFMGIFRVFIIAFMEVAAFNIGFYSMYVGAVYPLMVSFNVLAPFLIKKD